MSRYFIEVSYKGTGYAGFQVQDNARTIQGEVEKALEIFYRKRIQLTGSSRTDAGVHALQNYFHFDFEREVDSRNVYNINALLPADIAIKRLINVSEGAHCRFDAIWREYEYRVYMKKDPFVADVAFYYPFSIDVERMKEAAEVVKEEKSFMAFSKRRTQVKTYQCNVMESEWSEDGEMEIYRVRANRFLRGMVRGLVGTMLQVGRGKISVVQFREMIERGDAREADFSVPGHGLTLMRVGYEEGYFG
jgi:tRNA pseudouridine38-40 synthase